VDPRAVGLVVATFVATPAGALRQVAAPTLVIAGDQDSRGATADSAVLEFPG